MKYINAKDLLPDGLVQELQQYIQGAYLYVPAATVKGWGECSGYRQELEARNRAIFVEYRAGASAAGLAEKYSLSESAVRKIIRRQCDVQG